MKVSMPRAAACLVLGGLLASTAAAQNKVDLDRTTCKQFLEMPRDYTLVVLGWLQGYYLEENAEPVVDIEKVFADLLRLTEHCQGRPDEELMAAAEELFGKQAPAPPQAESPAPKCLLNLSSKVLESTAYRTSFDSRRCRARTAAALLSCSPTAPTAAPRRSCSHTDYRASCSSI